MALPKPSSYTDWVETNAAARNEPTVSKKETGWGSDERPPHQIWNWIEYQTDQWIKYLESITDEHAAQLALLSSFTNIYDAVLGSGGLATHPATTAGLIDALNDVPIGGSILITEPILMDAQVQVSKNDIAITCKPGVGFTWDAALGGNAGIRVSANGMRWSGGRFVGFDNGPATAILIDASSKYAIMKDIRFATTSQQIDDQSTEAVIYGTIEE